MKPAEFLLAKSWLLTIFIAILSFAGSALAAGLKEQVLHDFKGGVDGVDPTALVADQAGNLYGTTLRGGRPNCPQYRCGTVFKLTPSSGGAWSEAVLYRFKGGSDGQWPAGLIIDQAGNLYGTTVDGGSSNCAYGCGTVFRLTPAKSGHAWTETILYRFTGGSDGSIPLGRLIFDRSGNLYGTTVNGGNSNCAPGCGTVFRLTPHTSHHNWTETVLYRFSDGSDGALPSGGVIFDKKGNLYGTAQFGGGTGWGAVFMLAPHRGTWTETTIYSFTGGSDDGEPKGNLVFDQAGSLYGTTPGIPGTYGTVFQLTPPTQGHAWTETTIYHFTGNNGGRPLAGLIADQKGNLYGTTNVGGPSSNGSVFQLMPPAIQGGAWTETVLYNFAGRDGRWPDSDVIFGKGGALYGITPVGGKWKDGVVFKLVR